MSPGDSGVWIGSLQRWSHKSSTLFAKNFLVAHIFFSTIHYDTMSHVESEIMATMAETNPWVFQFLEALNTLMIYYPKSPQDQPVM